MQVSTVPSEARTHLVPQPDRIPEQGSPPSDMVMTIRRFVGALRKRWKIVFVIVAAALLLGIIATLQTIPIYRATTQMKIEARGVDVLNVQNMNSNRWIDEERAVNTQIELLKSHDMAMRVVKYLNLASNNTFFEKMRMGAVGIAAEPQQQRAARESAAAGALRGNVGIQPIEETRIVEVSFTSPDPGLAAQVANAYAAAAIQADLDRGMGTTRFAREFLENRIAQTRERLEASERAMIDYARRSSLIDTSAVRIGPDQTSAPSLGVSNLVALNSAYAAARTKRIQTDAQWRQGASNPAIAQLGGSDNANIQGLAAARAEASTQYHSQIGTRTADHPEMLRLAAKIRELDRNLGQEAAKSRATLRLSYELAAAQERSLGDEISRLKASSLDEQASNVQLGILKREVDTNRAFYDALLQRYKEISAASGSYENAISIVDEATPPGGPIRPDPFRNLAIALALGAIVAAGTVFLLENLDDTIRFPDQLQDKLGLSLIGVIPKRGASLHLGDDFLDSKSEVSEAYRSVQTTLNFASPSGAPTPLLVTSTEPSEGKSSTALATALSYARTKKRVLLIDADLRKPSLHKIIGEDNSTGFSELLSSQKQLTEVVKRHFNEQLSVITSGPLAPDPASLLAGHRLRQILDEAKDIFDIIIIDGPPVMGLADAPLIAAACQATLFVVEAGGTKSRHIKGAIERMRLANAHIIGVVMTKFDNKAEGYGDEYGYSYKYRYGDGVQAV